MTVAQLIEILKVMPGDMPVYRDDHEWGPLAVIGAHVADPGLTPLTGVRRKPGVVLR